MKITIYGVNFSPEATGIGKYTTEFADWLGAQGHQVQVICGQPHYPQWSLYPGYKQRFSHERRTENVQVKRVPHYIPRPAQVRALGRILMECSFTALSLRWWIPQFFSAARPDFVVAICPPLQLAVIPWFYQLVRRVPWIFWVQDFQVDAAFRLGMLDQGMLGKLLYRLEGFFLKRASWVVSISGPMCRRAIQKGAPAEAVVELPNWANIQHILMRPASPAFRASLQVAAEQVLIVYSGAMGQKQGLEIVIEVAERLRSDPGIVFILAGDGAAKQSLQRAAEASQLSNLRFLPVQAADQFAELLAAADIQLIVQKAEAADLVMPSKLTNILASGRPCLATASAGTALAEVLQQSEAGVVVPPGNVTEMVDAIVRLAGDADLRAIMGRNARRYAEQNLDRQAILEKFMRRLSQSTLLGTVNS